MRAAAAHLGLATATPIALKAFAEQLRELAPDACIVCSYGRIVPQALLDAAPVWLNVHPSLLPLYRGATPIQTAIRDGATRTGVTIIAMDAGMDSGDIVAQSPPVPIGETETYVALHDRLATLSATMLTKVLDAFAAGSLPRTPQNDALATFTSPFGKDDYRLIPGLTAKQTVDRIRSVAPRPGLKTGEDSGLPRFTLLRAHVTNASPLRPDVGARSGSVIAHRGYLFIAATDGWVAVDELIMAGGRPTDAAAFARGHAQMTGPLPSEAFAS